MTAKDPAAGERTVTLDVDLLGRAYKFACKESERAELEGAAAYLDAQMKGIRAAGKVAAVDRIAVMAALNIAHELLRARQRPGAADTASALSTAVPAIDDAAARRRIHHMQSAIDQVLADNEISS
jgi:cell division protein ZapA